MKTIGLCMIVKNEAEVILRCLESARPIVNYVLIEDTGSTDKTQKIIREWLDRVGIPGEVYDEPWRDFAYNRSHALARLRKNKDVDFALILDADDVLELPPGFKMPHLKGDSYTLEIRHQQLRHWRPHIVRNALPWRYEGLLHEFLSCPVGPDNRQTFPEEHSQQRLPGVRIRVGEEGARRQISVSERYRCDAALLESALSTETDAFLISRYTFYLAQSYRDCDEGEKALANYLKRAELGYWDQEVFISLYQAANLKAHLGYDAEDVLATYSRAHNVRKDRAESLHAAARYCRVKDRFELGYKFAQRALGMKAPRDGLFLERWVYDYGVLDEYAINAYWIGKFDDCQRACKRLLREGKIPSGMRERIEQNGRFAREKLSSPVDTKNKAPRRIGLCMIVKNESKVILRCLESVRRILDYVVIEDTGSTDGTQKIIREWLDRVGLPGEVYDEPWQDFAYNRSHALARLREKRDIDYALIMDADDVLMFDEDFDLTSFKENLSQDLYHVRIQHGPIWHSRVQICSNRREFQYRGVLHEFIEDAAGNSSSGTAEGFHMRIALEGARSADPDKYRKDAALLERALQSEQDPFLRSRYIFYLAQSYRDAGDKEKALENYLKRAELGYWLDEVFMSLFNVAQLKQALGRSFSDVVAAYERATEAAAHRAEALHGASRFCREANKFTEGFEYARRGLQIARPPGGLFVQNWVYDYGLLDEFAVNAYWIERYGDCLQACDRLLREKNIPVEMRTRIEQNARFAREKLSAPQLNVDHECANARSAVSDRAEPSFVATRVYTERDVNGAAFDQTACQVGAKIFICSTGRTGSYLLCRAMIHHGIGIPHEYFNGINAGIISTRFGLGTITSRDLEADGPARRAYIAALLERRTKNGIFAVKIHRGQYRQYFQSSKNLELFQGANFIYMYREDLVAQAVSFHMSLLTGRWSVDEAVATPPAVAPQFFDNDLIARHLVELAIQDSEWRSFFAKNDIRPLILSFEDIKDDLGAALRTIVKSFGLQLPVQNFDYIEPPVREYRGPAEPSKADIRAGFEQWLKDHQSVRDEVFITLYRAAESLQADGRPFDEVIAAYDRASNAAPHRAEALYAASRLCRLNDMFAEGYDYARRGLAIEPPARGPSVQQWIYSYGLLDEFAVNAYWIERYQECLDASGRLLCEGKIPLDMRDRVKRNAEFAAEKIRLMSSSAPVSAKPRTIGRTPTYSIITPTGGRGGILRLQHRGISEQTEGNFEWLILDDSPEPSTYFSRLTDERIHYQHVSHRLSIGAKRNLLNERARGEIIVHFDDDDYYSPDYLATMAKCFDTSIDVVKLSGWYVYSQVYRELGYWDLTQIRGLHLCWSKAPMASTVFDDDYAKGSVANSLLGFGFSLAYRRDSWKKVQFPDRDLREDGNFVRSILAAGSHLHQFADTAGICVHILHNGNTSRCYPQYRLPPFMIDRLVPAWAMEMLNS
jgi:glycosyltransferase involved in cell wall biosynthesis/LPS sulfotransferase NodH